MRGSESIRETRESQRGKGSIIGMSVMRENKTFKSRYSNQAPSAAHIR